MKSAVEESENLGLQASIEAIVGHSDAGSAAMTTSGVLIDSGQGKGDDHCTAAADPAAVCGEEQELVICETPLVAEASREEVQTSALEAVRDGGELTRYDIDELLELWEVSVLSEATWNRVLTALSPHMDDMFEMQATPNTKFQRRRGKNSERRQRFKAKREAMLSISRNENEDADFHHIHGERTDEGMDDTAELYLQKSGTYQVGKFVHRKGPYKPRHHHTYEDEVVESFQSQAFAVEGEPDFESGPPEDGWEYLRRVIWEAARCPKVVVANIDPEKLVSEQTPYMPIIPAITPCPPDLLPSKEWEQQFLADFTQLRIELSKLHAPLEACSERLPSGTNRDAWEILCFGSVTSSRAEDLEESGSVKGVEEDCGISAGPEGVDGPTEDEVADILHPSSAAAGGVQKSVEGVDSDKPSEQSEEVQASIQLSPQAHFAGEEGPDLTVPSELLQGALRSSSPEAAPKETLHEDSVSSGYGDGSSLKTAQLPTSGELHACDRVSAPIESLRENQILVDDETSSSHNFAAAATPAFETSASEQEPHEQILSAAAAAAAAEVPTEPSSARALDVDEPSSVVESLAAAAAASSECVDFYDRSCSGVDDHESTDVAGSVDRYSDSLLLETKAAEDEGFEPVDHSFIHGEQLDEEDHRIAAADQTESLAGYEIYTSGNILEESEDELRESILEIEEPVQQLFQRVFGVDEAWKLPLLHTLLRLDPVSRAALLRHHVNWLDGVDCGMPQQRALWLLGLAAVVDTPLNGDTTASVRALLRHCARVRASMQSSSSDDDDGDNQLHMLNALISIAGLFFGQAESHSS
ncbi:gem associated protein 2 [Marchantia polymorpha subsp. ruderalis]